jgi:hypothetical protein
MKELATSLRSSRLYRALYLVVAAGLVAEAAIAGQVVMQFQKIQKDKGTDTWKGKGKGPFTDAYPDGVPDDELVGARLGPEMFNEREFGSIGGTKGGKFPNWTQKIITDIHIKLLGGDTFDTTNTKDGDDFDAKFSDDKTELTLTAKEGKGLQPGADGDHAGETLWMKVPKADQPNTPGGTVKYKGSLTPEPCPKSSEKEEKVPKAEDNGGGGQPSPHCFYNPTQGSIFFQMGSIDTIQYFDGSISTNDPTEPILGAVITLGPMSVVGPSSDVPGALELSESGLTLSQGTNIVFAANVADVLLLPDNSVPGFDTLVQGMLTWEQAPSDTGSRFLSEHFGTSDKAAFFFRSQLLSATAGLTQGGSSPGVGYIAAVSGGSIAPSPPRFAQPYVLTLTPSAVALSLVGESNRTYRVDGSFNLSGWTPLQSVQLVGTETNIVDAEVAGLSGRFYRAVRVPGSNSGTNFVVSASSSLGGTVAPFGTLLTYGGQSRSFVALPDTNYVVHAWFVDGFLAQRGGTTFVLNNVTADHDVLATFKSSAVP